MTSTRSLDPAPADPAPPPRRGDWVFLKRSALPDDPDARRLEKKGRWWLVLSYVLCPCHLPVTLALLGVAFGGTAFGSIVAGNAGWVAAVMVALYAAVLARGFTHLRRAKRLLAPGQRLSCTPDACEIVDAPHRSPADRQ